MSATNYPNTIYIDTSNGLGSQVVDTSGRASVIVQKRVLVSSGSSSITVSINPTSIAPVILACLEKPSGQSSVFVNSIVFTTDGNGNYTAFTANFSAATPAVNYYLHYSV